MPESMYICTGHDGGGKEISGAVYRFEQYLEEIGIKSALDGATWMDGEGYPSNLCAPVRPDMLPVERVRQPSCDRSSGMTVRTKTLPAWHRQDLV